MRFCWDPPTETRVHWEKKGGKCMGEGHKKLNISEDESLEDLLMGI